MPAKCHDKQTKFTNTTHYYIIMVIILSIHHCRNILTGHTLSRSDGSLVVMASSPSSSLHCSSSSSPFGLLSFFTLSLSIVDKSSLSIISTTSAWLEPLASSSPLSYQHKEHTTYKQTITTVSWNNAGSQDQMFLR